MGAYAPVGSWNPEDRPDDCEHRAGRIGHSVKKREHITERQMAEDIRQNVELLFVISY